jgi:hypothetical protein
LKPLVAEKSSLRRPGRRKALVRGEFPTGRWLGGNECCGVEVTLRRPVSLGEVAEGDLAGTKVDSSVSSIDVVADVAGKIGLCGDDGGALPATEDGVRKSATFLEEGNVVEDVSNEVLGDIEA